MKIALIALLFAASAYAQQSSAGVASACGPKDVSFDVKLDHSQHTLAQPEPGKARVYFIQETGIKVTFGVYPTTSLGIDGAWVGAYKNDSYISVSVDPGEHHVCASLQALATGHQVELAHFTAEAGKIYYYRTRLILSQGQEYFELIPVDSDEARYLVASFPLSVSHPKK
jgi:hypothetical protein